MSQSPHRADVNNKTQQLLSKIQQYYPLRAIADDGLLPFERSDGWIELGVTALARYIYCPFEFYLEYGLRLAQPIGPQLSFGTALHRVFELYYRAVLAGQQPDNAQLHSLLDEHWSHRGYETLILAEQDRNLAHQTVDRFLKREAEASRRPVGVEVPIRLEIPETKLRLRGKIDAIFEVEDGGIQLRDYKTGRTQTDPEKLSKKARDDFQLRTYALAYDTLGGANVREVVLDYLVTGTEGSATLSSTIMRNHYEKVASLAERIRNREFAPTSQATHECSAVRYYGTGEQDEMAVEVARSLGEDVV